MDEDTMKIVLRFFKIGFILILGVSLSYLLTSCKSSSVVEPGSVSGNMLTALPQVSVTDSDYTASSLESAMSGKEIHSRFTRDYRDKYSESLRESIVGYILIELERKGEDVKKFAECFKSLPYSESGKALPCLVESAKFNGKECYLVLFNWGIGEEDFGHYAYYAVEKSSRTILESASCR